MIPAASQATTSIPPPLSWRIDRDRKLIFIDLGPAVSDYDLENKLPGLWEGNPDTIGFDCLVDYRHGSGSGNWTWHGLRCVARRWKDYLGDRTTETYVALLTTDFWAIQIVNNLLPHLFSGNHYRCFEDRDAALQWISEMRSGS